MRLKRTMASLHAARAVPIWLLEYLYFALRDTETREWLSVGNSFFPPLRLALNHGVHCHSQFSCPVLIDPSLPRRLFFDIFSAVLRSRLKRAGL
jgi:hypothetical protein